MQRRDFLRWMAATPLLQVAYANAAAPSVRGNYQRLLILVELKGGNDALNMLVPYADPLYYELRPRIAIKRDDVLTVSKQAGLHPAMQSIMPVWQDGELALVQGLGYAQPNLSHFRSIEIWDTASASDEYLPNGWLARTFGATPPPKSFAADGVLIGSNDMGPMLGVGPRAIVLSSPEQFLRQAKLASSASKDGNSALAHLRKVDQDVVDAANRLESSSMGKNLRTEFPSGPFGNTVKSACRVLASGGKVAALRLTQTGYDTHRNQPDIHANLLKSLSEGLAALRSGLQELNLWDNALIMTYAEFGRRVKENGSNGTDHGTAATHLVMGGDVKGGLYGDAPRLDQLDREGNLKSTTDFRRLYATAIQGWWGLNAESVLQGKFAPLDILRS